MRILILPILLATLALFLALPAHSQTATNPAPVAIACAYNNGSPPTLAIGTFGWTQCDIHGSIISSPASLFASTYSAGGDYLGYTTPTDIITICGSATKTVRIISILGNGQATAATQVDMALLKRSTPDTGGTPTTVPAVPRDSADPAATAVVTTYGSAPTLGTAVPGEIFDIQNNWPAPGGGNPSSFWGRDYIRSNEKPPTLHGTTECLAINFLGAAFPAGGKFSYTIAWTEE